MNYTHKLVTDEIKNKIRQAVKTNGRNPGFILAQYKNKPPKLTSYEDLDTEEPTEKQLRFCGYAIPKDEVEDYILWFSGVIHGALIENKCL